MNGTRVHRNMHGLEASDDALAGPCDALASLHPPRRRPPPPSHVARSYDSEGNAQVLAGASARLLTRNSRAHSRRGNFAKASNDATSNLKSKIIRGYKKNNVDRPRPKVRHEALPTRRDSTNDILL